jgi:cell division septal protein FtsQ
MAMAVAGLIAALHSPLFIVRVVEVSDQPLDSPLDPREVSALAAVPLAKTSLFALDLKSIEKRLLTNHWVRDVVLTKRFPQTLAIQVIYRQPVALLQGPQGVLKYVDTDGSIFGPVTLRGRADLPVIHGLPQGAAGEKILPQAVAALKAWSAHPWKTVNQISQLAWDEEEGFTAWIAFEPSYRVSVVLGPDWGTEGNIELFSRIDAVLQYSASRSIPIRQIYADANKKIVVRTARRS